MRIGLAPAVVAALALAAATPFAAIGASAPSAANTVLAVGDSLSVGTHPYLRRHLHGYRVAGRHGVGLHAHDAASIVSASRALPSVLVISAGTNDHPSMVAVFVRAVAEILRTAGSTRCVVWPTIARPPVDGTSYDGFNRALAHATTRHPNLMLVDWAALVRRHPHWLRRDGVHAVAEGYRARAAAIAAAVKTRCAR